MQGQGEALRPQRTAGSLQAPEPKPVTVKTRCPWMEGRLSAAPSWAAACTSPRCVIGDLVLPPSDEGFGEHMDLALEAGHTALLTPSGLRIHVEVRNGCSLDSSLAADHQPKAVLSHLRIVALIRRAASSSIQQEVADHQGPIGQHRGVGTVQQLHPVLLQVISTGGVRSTSLPSITTGCPETATSPLVSTAHAGSAERPRPSLAAGRSGARGAEPQWGSRSAGLGDAQLWGLPQAHSVPRAGAWADPRGWGLGPHACLGALGVQGERGPLHPLAPTPVIRNVF